MSAFDGRPQHQHVLGDDALTVLAPPTPGPLAILPHPHAAFHRAIEGAGGHVSPLDSATRGIIWLSYTSSDDLSQILRQHPGVGWVQLPWAGVDAFAETIREFGHRVLFTSAKGAFAQPVAEHALAMTLALLRYFPRRARLASWDNEVLGRSLYRRNVTIIGAGGIARELIRLLAPFDVHVTVVRRRAGNVPGAHVTLTSLDLHEALRDADVVVIAAAHTGHTERLIDAGALKAMPRHAVLVNIARGPLIDSDALIAALQSGKLAGAALDVTMPEPLPNDHPLWTAPNILITPHQADTPDMTEPLLTLRVETNVRAFLSQSPFIGCVDPQAGY